MAKHNELGNDGEIQAANYLKAQGYAVKHRNWRKGRNELDIVAQKSDTLVFIEVKTRSGEVFGDAQEAITLPKIRRLVLAADAYIKLFKIDLPVRFDVITVVGKGKDVRIEHIPDAFYPPIG